MSTFSDNLPPSISQALAKLMKEQKMVKDKSDAQLENIKLQLKIESCQSIVSQQQIKLSEMERTYKKSMEDIWQMKADFIEEINRFNDEKGISSPWWNAQLMSIANPSIDLSSDVRRKKQNELEEMKLMLADGEKEVEKLQKEILILKEKDEADQAMIDKLSRMEDELKQEPYGPEFLSIKSKIQKKQETCAQLRALAAMKNTMPTVSGANSLRQCDIENQDFNPASFIPRDGNPTFQQGKVFKVRQVSTIVYRR